MDAKLIEELTAGMPNTEELGDRDTMIDPPGTDPPEQKSPAPPSDESLGSLLAEARRSIVARSSTANGSDGDSATGFGRLGAALACGGRPDFADTVLERPPTPPTRRAPPPQQHAETLRVAPPRLLLQAPRRGGGARFAAALAGLGVLGIAVGTTLGLIFRSL